MRADVRVFCQNVEELRIGNGFDDAGDDEQERPQKYEDGVQQVGNEGPLEVLLESIEDDVDLGILLAS